MYSVTAASRMSGVHPETLRAWERRYEAIQPRRDERGRRMYAAEDVERLRLLRRATELGHAISRLAGLDLDALREFTEEDPEAPAGLLPPARGRGELNQLVSRLLDAVARYRADECDEVLGLAATFLHPERLVRQVVAPALDAVAEAVSRGEMRVAQERLLGCCARRTISSLLGSYRRRAGGPVVLLATLPGEAEETALMVTALMVASEGLDCVYLGTEVPHGDLADAARCTDARCVALSCVDEAPAPALLSDICAALPEDCELWLAGQAVSAAEDHPLPRSCMFFNEPDHLREHARALCRT